MFKGFQIIICTFFALTLYSAQVFSQKSFDTSNDLSRLDKIGIYIYPSDEEFLDRLVYNNLSLYLVSLGYQVEDLTPFIQKPNWSMRTFQIEDNQPKIIQYLFRKIEETKVNLNRLDAIAIVSPKWKTINFERDSGIVGNPWVLERLGLKLQLSFIEVNNRHTLIEGETADTTEIYVDDTSLDQLSKSVLYQLMKGETPGIQYTRMPTRVLIQRSLSRIIGQLPLAREATVYKPEYHFPVIFVADQKYRDFYQNDWQSILQQHLTYVNDIFMPQFNIAFSVVQFGEWNIGNETDLPALLNKLMKESGYIKHAFVIGVLLDKEIAKDWQDRRMIGMSKLLGNFIVIKDIPCFSEVSEWDPLEEAITLAHEFGHAFGAPHIGNSLSIMYPSVGSMSYEFDEANQKIIDLAKKNFFTLLQDSTAFRDHIINMTDMFHSFHNNINYISLLAKLQNSYMLQFNKLGSGNFQIADSSLILAIRGYELLQQKNWAEARDNLEEALRRNQDLMEVYLYLGEVYSALGDEKKSKEFYEKAKKAGYIIETTF